MACLGAASTSHMRRLTGTFWPGAAASSLCGGSDATGGFRDFTYSALSAAINRFGNVLAQRGIGKGGRVFSLLGRSPELYIAALGTLKNGSVFSPLFSAFGPEPIKARMAIGEAQVLITSEALYRRKVEPWRKELASLEYVFLTECSSNPPAGTASLEAAMAAAPDTFETVWTSPGDMALRALYQRHDGTAKGGRARS